MLGSAGTLAWAEDGELWLDADTNSASLVVRNLANQELARFENISIGSNGTTQTHWRGDQTTPLGEYRITAIQPSLRYRLFIALNYPTADQAQAALASGGINPLQFRRIMAAHNQGRTPPADTRLGGNIGLHGLGQASEAVHLAANWTRGCIALTNSQIDSLRPWLTVGMRVRIR